MRMRIRVRDWISRPSGYLSLLWSLLSAKVKYLPVFLRDEARDSPRFMRVRADDSARNRAGETGRVG
jgi:hypothetical protein